MGEIRADEGFSGNGGFDEKVIIADEGDDFSFVVEGVFSEHFFVGDVPYSLELIKNVVDEGLIGGHGLGDFDGDDGHVIAGWEAEVIESIA